MREAVHRVAPLRRYYTNRGEVRLDLRGVSVRGEGAAVDEERLVLDGGVGREAVGRDLVFKDL